MPDNRLRFVFAVCATLSVVAIGWYIKRQRDLKKISECDRGEGPIKDHADADDKNKDDVDDSMSDSDTSSSGFSYTTATDASIPSASSTSISETDITTSHPSSANNSTSENKNDSIDVNDLKLNSQIDNLDNFYDMLSSPVVQNFDRRDGNTNNQRLSMDSQRMRGCSPLSDVVHVYGDSPVVQLNSPASNVEQRIDRTLSVHTQFQCPSAIISGDDHSIINANNY